MAIYNFGGGPQDVISDYTGQALGGVTLQVWADEALTEQITALSVLTASGWESASAVTSGTSGHMLGRMRFRVADQLRVWLADHAGGSWVMDAHETMAVAVAEVEGIRDDMIDTANATIASAIATVDAKRDQIITDATAAGEAAGATAGALTDAKLDAVLQQGGASIETLAGLFEPLAKGPGFDIVLIAGQSNAIGCGRPIPAQPDPANAGLFQLAQTGPSAGQVVPLTEPLLGPGADGSEGVGPGPEVARRWRARTGRQVLLVPVAYGGTGLFRGRWHPQRGDLYIRLVEQTIKAMQIPGARFIALLWVQGENDAVRWVSAQDYRYWLNTLITEFRKDTHQLAAPVVIGSMVPSWINGGSSGNAPAIHQVHAAAPGEWQFPTQPDRVAFAQGPDGPGQDLDGIHYTAAMARELGLRMYDQLVGLGVV